jgi:hypothetical protein
MSRVLWVAVARRDVGGRDRDVGALKISQKVLYVFNIAEPNRSTRNPSSFRAWLARNNFMLNKG